MAGAASRACTSGKCGAMAQHAGIFHIPCGLMARRVCALPWNRMRRLLIVASGAFATRCKGTSRDIEARITVRASICWLGMTLLTVDEVLLCGCTVIGKWNTVGFMAVVARGRSVAVAAIKAVALIAHCPVGIKAAMRARAMRPA